MRRGFVAGLAGLAVLCLAGCGQSPQASPPQAASTPGTSSGSAAAPSAPAHAPHLRIRPAGFRLPSAFGREAVINTGQYAVVGGGLLAGDTSTASAYQLDPGAAQVSAMPSLPVPVHDTAGGLASGIPIVIGGGNASEQSVVQGWNGHEWHVLGHLPQARSDLVAATVGQQVIVLGGYKGSRPAEPTILRTSNGRVWNSIGTLPVPVRYAASTVADGSIWLFGGETDNVERKAIQRVDPETGQAQLVGKLPVGLGHAVAIPLGSRILIAGGRLTPNTVTDRMWWFDPSTGAVTPAGHLPHPLADSAVTRKGDVFYLVGGETPSFTDGILAVTYH